MDHIELNGTIGPDSSYVVEDLLKKIQKCRYGDVGNWYSTAVFLNSNGGFAEDGFKIGFLFKQYQVAAKLLVSSFAHQRALLP